MGVIKRGILGGFSGKVANVVGGTWKGIDYIRSLPLSVANPNTAAQQAQRTKFSGVVDFASETLTSIVKPLWDRFAVKMSGYNHFIQSNIDNWATIFPDVAADFVMSRGSLTGVDNLDGEDGAAANLALITWDDNSGTGTATATDEVYIIVMNENQGNFGVLSGTAVRSDTSAIVTTPTDAVNGDILNVYVAFRTANGFSVSDSSFVFFTSAV